MTTDLKTQLDQFKSDLRSIIACEGVTDGPWEVTGIDHKSGVDYVKVRGTQLGQKWQIADVRFIPNASIHEEPEAQNLAAFIARSRTITPLMAKMLMDQVEWLEKLNSAANGLYQNCPFADQLTTMITTWKEWKV